MDLARNVSKAVFSAVDLGHRRIRGPRILIYHQVGTNLGRQMEVTTENFVRQVEWLLERYEIVTLDEAVRRYDEPDSDGLVVLTFDDGYHDTFTTAFPIMALNGVPFTLYISTQQVDNASDGLTDLAAPSLTWKQVREMYKSGLMTVGNHTHTHLDLRDAAATEITEELETANETIHTRLSVEARHFAYPWGYWSREADRQVRTRFDTAVLGAPVSSHPTGDPFFSIDSLSS